MKRCLDISISLLALILLSPILAIASIAISLQDGNSPLFVGTRIGRGGKKFRFVKLRSMKIGSDTTGVDTTVDEDPRITRIGHIIRNTKIDELPEFWHVLTGDMSLVGPRPNLESEVQLYTEVEHQLLSVCPGITDISSIVFSDMGSILRDADDPNVAYGQIVRPWKSRLGIWYIENQTMLMDVSILLLTGISIVSHDRARKGVVRLLEKYDAPEDLQKLPSSLSDLQPTPPPGSAQIFTEKERTAKIMAAGKVDENN